MDTIGKSVASMTGTKITTGVITNITNEFNTKIKNKTYTKNDITNIINNINNNTVSIKNDQGCNLSASGINTITINNCNLDNAFNTLHQTASINSLQQCTQVYVSNMLSTNTGLINALNTASSPVSFVGGQGGINNPSLTQSQVGINNPSLTQSHVGINKPSLTNHYDKYKKIYITVIILLLVLAIILIIYDNADTIHDSAGYQLTTTPGMKTEM